MQLNPSELTPNVAWSSEDTEYVVLLQTVKGNGILKETRIEQEPRMYIPAVQSEVNG